MTSIHQRIQSNELNATIAVVISNKASAPGLAYARDQGIPVEVFETSQFETNDDYELALVACLVAHKVDLVVLAGYMKLVGDPMLTAFAGRMVNIHPSLLPSFKGLNAQQQALDYGVKVSGCTAHYVVKEMDAGPIIMQAAVAVQDDDTVESLSDRILFQEHQIYFLAIQIALTHLD